MHTKSSVLYILFNKIKKEWGIEILQEKKKIKRRKDIIDLSPLE